MKKLTALVMILSMISLASGAAIADDGSYQTSGPYQKGERGVLKIVKSPLKVSDTVSEVSEQHNPLFGVTFGLIEGSVKLFTDVISGTADIITAPIGSYDKEMEPIEIEHIKK